MQYEEKIPKGKVSKELQDNHPELFKTLNIFWGTADMLQFLNNTMKTDRPDRVGFSEVVFGDLMYCFAYHVLLFPIVNDQHSFKVA